MLTDMHEIPVELHGDVSVYMDLSLFSTPWFRRVVSFAEKVIPRAIIVFQVGNVASLIITALSTMWVASVLEMNILLLQCPLGLVLVFNLISAWSQHSMKEQLSEMRLNLDVISEDPRTELISRYLDTYDREKTFANPELLASRPFIEGELLRYHRELGPLGGSACDRLRAQTDPKMFESIQTDNPFEAPRD